MATFLFKDLTIKPDYLLIGYSEETSIEIANAILKSEVIESKPGIINCKTAPEELYLNPTPASQLDDLDQYAFLEYELYPNWNTHLPLVEESRGCPHSCEFCGNSVICKNNKRFYRKSSEIIKKELHRVWQLWGEYAKTSIILMCSNFGTIASDTIDFLNKVNTIADEVSLMAAMRVDSDWEQFVHLMSPCFEQIHFGLESGSPEILLRMNKTKNPEHYLEKASKAFRAFSKENIHVGCNFIFGYPGENGKTLSETFLFLLNNKPYIDSLWGGSLIEYPGCPLTKKFEEYSQLYGLRREVLSNYCDILHAYPLSPSNSLSFSQVSLTATILMKMFNTKKTFYEHYKWYPGLISGNGRLLDESNFYSLFLEGIAHIEDLGADLTI